MLPAAAGFMSQKFGANHPALDIANSKGTPVVAPHAMQVTYVGRMGSGTSDAGLVVQLGDSNLGHRLCHLDKAVVAVGQWVAAGDKVGEMGNSGYVIPAATPRDPNAGTHLHWVMLVGGSRVDPEKHLTGGKGAAGNEGEIMQADDLNLLAQIGWNQPVNMEDNFVRSYTGKPVRQTLIDMHRSSANILLRTKAANFDNVQAALEVLRQKADELAANPTRAQFDELHKDLIACDTNMKAAVAQADGLRLDKEESEKIGQKLLRWLGDKLKGQS